MRKSKKKMVIAAAACAMIGVMAIGGTMAYLTDMESATNTFTIGKVQIDLEEPNYPGNESAEVKNIVPNQIIKKDPKVENTGNNDAIVFLKVEMPKKDVVVANADGTKKASAPTELFKMLDTDIDPDVDGGTAGNKWVEIATDDSAADKTVHVYAYKDRLAKGATTTNLFQQVQLENVIEGQVDEATENIKVTAYAIQATEVMEGDNDITDTLDKANLTKIYNIYVSQNTGVTAPDADTNNAKDLKGGNLPG